MKIILVWLNILDVSSGNDIKFSLQQVHSGKRRIIKAAKDMSSSEMFVYGRSELDSHADTTVAGDNFCIFNYTVKYCGK